MRYINKYNGDIYEKGSITINHNGVLFIGVPTVAQLETWGYEDESVADLTTIEYKQNRKLEIKNILLDMDYLTAKELDGEDMSKYDKLYKGDYKAYRRKLRAEYNKLEEEIELMLLEAELSENKEDDSTDEINSVDEDSLDEDELSEDDNNDNIETEEEPIK